MEPPLQQRWKSATELVTAEKYLLCLLVLLHRWTTWQIYWEIHNYPFLNHKLLIEMCHQEKSTKIEKETDEMQIDFPHTRFNWRWVIEKSVSISCMQQIKFVFLSFTKPYLQFFATTSLVTNVRYCVIHDTALLILLNSTNGKNTYPTYNIIGFSRLSKIVSRKLLRHQNWKILAEVYLTISNHQLQSRITQFESLTSFWPYPKTFRCALKKVGSADWISILIVV